MSLGVDQTLRFSQSADGKPLIFYDWETQGALCAAYSPAGSHIALGRSDTAVILAKDPYPTTPPMITEQPANHIARYGARVDFQVVAAGLGAGRFCARCRPR